MISMLRRVLYQSDLDQDEEIFKNQIREREAAKRREEEAREREAELELQRLEQERVAREEEELRQAEREKALEKKKGVGRGTQRTVDPSSSGVRGVRGTRASMRARGVATGTARGRIPPNTQGGCSCYLKVQHLDLGRPPSLDLSPQHQPGRVRFRHAVVGVRDGTQRTYDLRDLLQSLLAHPESR